MGDGNGVLVQGAQLLTRVLHEPKFQISFLSNFSKHFETVDVHSAVARATHEGKVMGIIVLVLDDFFLTQDIRVKGIAVRKELVC